MAINAYVESRVLSADPLELVQLLYQGALNAVREARACLSQRDIAGRSAAISRAIDILSELTASLDHEKGGELSQNLARLYDYIGRLLLDANFRQIDEPMAESLGLLATLAEAWEQIRSASAENIDAPAREEEELACAGRPNPYAMGSVPTYQYQAWSL